jgi:hypothetical protein
MARQTRKRSTSPPPVEHKQPVVRDVAQMLPFVQIPKEPTREPATKGVRQLTVKATLTNDQIKAREGTYFEKKDMEILDEDVDIYREDEEGHKKLLARFRKNVFPKELLELAWDAFYKTAAPSRNRGAAAGPIQLKSAYWQKRKPTEVSKWSAKYIQNGKVSAMRVNNNVFSSVLGYFEQTPFMGLPCRLTSYTQKYFKEFTKGIPFLQEIDQCFKKLVPEAHAKQLARAKQQPNFQVANTAFSSITLNRNFRTALHMDDGDFKEGFGNLSVLEYGEYSGGETLFPQFGIGFNVRTGDFLAMDVHQWHCNTELYETEEQKKNNTKLPKIYDNAESTGTLGQEKPFTRISFVCYLREKMVNCTVAPTRKYYARIGFSPTKGFLPKGKMKTQKKKREEDAE